MSDSHKENPRISYVRFGLIVLLCFVLILVALLLLHFWEKQQGHSPSQDTPNSHVMYQGREYVRNPDLETFLVLGLDKMNEEKSDSYSNDRQADFLVLFVFDKQEKNWSAIHINRDTMTSVNVLGVAGQTVDTVTQQIALAHTYGNGREVSCRNTSDAVSVLLYNLKINHYLSLTMDAVPILNDIVGGVELEILDDFSGIDDMLIQGETITLTGEHALSYIRARGGMVDSTNERRMVRQRQYMEALYKKASVERVNHNLSLEDLLSLSDYFVSDCTVNQLQTLFDNLFSFSFEGIRTLPGSSVAGDQFMEFYPDEIALQQFVIETFYVPVP